jgi:hypothetical protein
VTIDPAVLKELQYIVDLHRKHGAANPFEDVQRLVAYVLASVADGSRRPGAWERSMLESMGLVAYGDEHEHYRAHYGAAADGGETSLAPPSDTAPASAGSTTIDDPADMIADIVRLLFLAVGALNSVLTVFDNHESRNPERSPRESAALQKVYQALGRPWPADEWPADEQPAAD